MFQGPWGGTGPPGQGPQTFGVGVPLGEPLDAYRTYQPLSSITKCRIRSIGSVR